MKDVREKCMLVKDRCDINGTPVILQKNLKTRESPPPWSNTYRNWYYRKIPIVILEGYLEDLVNVQPHGQHYVFRFYLQKWKYNQFCICPDTWKYPEKMGPRPGEKDLLIFGHMSRFSENLSQLPRPSASRYFYWLAFEHMHDFHCHTEKR